MRKVETLKQMKDVKFNKGDFILQHKNTAFTEIYQTDKILGQGTFLMQDSFSLRYRWLWKSHEMYS
jgi:hypothetical protein